MPCLNCNDNSPFQVYNNQSTYANSCLPVECGGSLTNSKCVYYSGPALPCSGISVNDSLEVILQKMDDAICTAVGDYSTYNTYCLAPISTQREFVEAISDYVCTTNTTLSDFIDTDFPAYQAAVTAQFADIEVPGITCSIASVTPTDTLVQVLNKYCSTFSTLNSAMSLSGVTWDTCFTVVSTPTTIAQGFSVLADQVCQVKALTTGGLPVFNNIGTCLPSPGASDTLVSTIDKIKTRLCQTGTFDYTALTFGCATAQTTLQTTIQEILTRVDDYIKNKLTFSGDFIVSQTDSGNLCLGKTVNLATPIANNDRLVATSATDDTPGTLIQKLVGTGVITVTEIGSNPTKQLQISSSALATVSRSDSYSIALTGNGTSGSPLIANLSLSATAGNQASINSDGLYVAAVAAPTYIFTNSNSVNMVNTAGSIASTVRIDNTVPNLIQISTNGLFATPQTITNTPITVVSTASLSLAVSGTDLHTLTGNVAISTTAGNALTVNGTGLFVAGATAYTFSTGLTNTLGTITVNDIQNITRLSNLTSNGLVKTTSSNGTLAIATAGTDYQAPITLTTTGSSGAATLIGNTLNIPNYSGGGSGTVTTVSVVSANGFGGSVATATSTPAITLTTSVSGILKGDGTGVTAAVAGTDYQIPITASNGMSYSAGNVTLGGTLTGNTTITGGTYYMAFLGSIATLNQSNTPFSAASTITSTGTETAQYIMSGVSGALVVNNASTFTPYSSSKHGAVSGSVYKNSAGNWSGPLTAIYGCVEVAGAGNVTSTVALRAFRPMLTTGQSFSGTITNAVGLYIDDISTSTVNSSITNKYAIYQEGATDINLLNGKLIMANLPTYADNTAASSLPTGQFYKTATGVVMVKY